MTILFDTITKGLNDIKEEAFFSDKRLVYISNGFPIYVSFDENRFINEVVIPCQNKHYQETMTAISGKVEMEQDLVMLRLNRDLLDELDKLSATMDLPIHKTLDHLNLDITEQADKYIFLPENYSQPKGDWQICYNRFHDITITSTEFATKTCEKLGGQDLFQAVIALAAQDPEQGLDKLILNTVVFGTDEEASMAADELGVEKLNLGKKVILSGLDSVLAKESWETNKEKSEAYIEHVINRATLSGHITGFLDKTRNEALNARLKQAYLKSIQQGHAKSRQAVRL